MADTPLWQEVQRAKEAKDQASLQAIQSGIGMMQTMEEMRLRRAAEARQQQQYLDEIAGGAAAYGLLPDYSNAVDKGTPFLPSLDTGLTPGAKANAMAILTPMVGNAGSASRQNRQWESEQARLTHEADVNAGLTANAQNLTASNTLAAYGAANLGMGWAGAIYAGKALHDWSAARAMLDAKSPVGANGISELRGHLPKSLKGMVTDDWPATLDAQGMPKTPTAASAAALKRDQWRPLTESELNAMSSSGATVYAQNARSANGALAANSPFVPGAYNPLAMKPTPGGTPSAFIEEAKRHIVADPTFAGVFDNDLRSAKRKGQLYEFTIGDATYSLPLQDITAILNAVREFANSQPKGE